MDIKEAVQHSFNDAADDVGNSERAINLSATKKDGAIIVNFDVDGDDRGIHSGSWVKFKEGRVIVSLCEMIEGGGIENIMEDELKTFPLENISDDCFKTLRQKIKDVLIYEMDIDYDGNITGHNAATERILMLLNQ